MHKSKAPAEQISGKNSNARGTLYRRTNVSQDQSSSEPHVHMTLPTSKRDVKDVLTENERPKAYAFEINYPKTKLRPSEKSQDDRSSSRLKSFPAEKIKKIDGSLLLRQPAGSSFPRENSQETSGSFFVPDQNIRHGDASPFIQNIKIVPRSQPQNVSVSQQNVPNFHPVENVNQSEGALSSPNPATNSGRQSHRPFVPSPARGVPVRELSPKKANVAQPVASQSPTAYPSDLSAKPKHLSKVEVPDNVQQMVPCPESPQVTSEFIEPNYDKQPAGGRSIATYRKAVMQQKQNLQKQIPQEQVQQQPPYSSNNVTPVPYAVWPTGGQMPVIPTLETKTHGHGYLNPQQTYQQMQHNIAYQQQMQQRAMHYQQQAIAAQKMRQVQQPIMNHMQQRAYYDYYNQQHQKQAGQAIAGRGMTSPQDLSINRIRTQHADARQVQMPVANRGLEYTVVPQSNQIQNTPVLEESPNIHPQMNPFVIDTPSTYSKGAQYHQQQAQHPLYGQNNYQSGVQNQIQSANQMKSTSQVERKSSAHAQKKQSSRKGAYRFTPEMIRDQERLIKTMQQQRIPEDVMSRQFSTLLNEQKRQLTYLEQFSQNEESIDTKVVSTVSKKISKIQNEEKPEWMIRITPPRIFQNDSMKEQYRSSSIQQQKVYDQNHRITPQQDANGTINPGPNSHNDVHQQYQAQYQEYQHHPSHEMSQLQHYHQQIQNQQHPTQQHQPQHLQHQEQHQQHQTQHQQHQTQPQQNQTQYQHQMHPQYQTQLQHQIHPQYQNDPNQMWQGQNNYWQRKSNVPVLSTPSYHPYNQNQKSSMPVLNHNNGPHSSVPPPNNQYTNQPQYQLQQHPQHQQHLQHLQQQEMWPNWQAASAVTTSNSPQSSPDTQYGLEDNTRRPEEAYQRNEPSSLLKQRIYKEAIQPQKRNNGLQDPETVRHALEALKNPESIKGLEYLENLNKKQVTFKLNGAQDPIEVPKTMMQPPEMWPESLHQPQRQVSANGLENRRNPNNPLPASKPKRAEERIPEYPRQKLSHQQNYNFVAERENGTTAPAAQYAQHPQVEIQNKFVPQNTNELKDPGRNQMFAMPYKVQEEHSPQYQQAQQFYQNQQMLAKDGQGDTKMPEVRDISGHGNTNQAGGDAANSHTQFYGPNSSPFNNNKTVPDQYGILQSASGNGILIHPEIQEPRVIGGVTFLARKPNYLPSAPISPDFSGSKYLVWNAAS